MDSIFDEIFSVDGVRLETNQLKFEHSSPIGEGQLFEKVQT